VNVGREWIVDNPFVGIIVRGPNEVGCSHPLGRLTHHASPFLSAQPDVPNEAAQLLFSSSWAQTVRARTLASTAGRPISAVRRRKARRSATRVAVSDAAAPGEGRSGLGRRLSATQRPECLPGDALTTPQHAVKRLPTINYETPVTGSAPRKAHQQRSGAGLPAKATPSCSLRGR
jgi:hypothetical protein